MAQRLHSISMGEGRPIVILHGGRLDHRHMADALEPVFQARGGWRRLYVDLPGCGGSQGFSSVQSQDDVLAEVAGFFREVSPGASCAAIGESRGAYLLQGLAYAHPELLSGFTLIVPGGLTPEARRELPPQQALVADPALLARLDPPLRDRAKGLVVQRPAIVEKIARTKLPAAAAHDEALEARVAARFLFSFHDDIAARPFDKPALIVSGRQDSIAGYADSLAGLAAYPRSTYALLDTAGHALSWERPAVFKALVLDWLDRLEAAGS